MFKHKELLETGATLIILLALWTLAFMVLGHAFGFRDMECFFCYEAVEAGMQSLLYGAYVLMGVCVLSGAWDDR